MRKKHNSWLLCLDNLRKHYTNLRLWNYIQRDVIIELITGYLVIANLDSRMLIELNDSISEKYICRGDEKGEYYISVPVGDLRLVTELIEFHDELWDYGEFINFVVYPREADSYNDCGPLYTIRPLGDNIGLLIEGKSMRGIEELIREKIECVLKRYNISVRVSEEKY